MALAGVASIVPTDPAAPTVPIAPVAAPVPAGRRSDPAARDRLAALTTRVTTAVLARERSVPVAAALRSVLPSGLACGSTALVSGSAAVSTAALLVAGAVEAGAWVGAIGLDGLGVEACREAGIALERLVLVRGAAGLGDELAGQALAALVDGFDVVLVGPGCRLRAGTARRVQARLGQRGAVLVVVGAAGAFTCDLTVDTGTTWHGLGRGHGHLRARQVAVVVEGRRAPRPRRTTVWFPNQAGRISEVDVAPLGEAPGGTAPSGDHAVRPLRRTG